MSAVLSLRIMITLNRCRNINVNLSSLKKILNGVAFYIFSDLKQILILYILSLCFGQTVLIKLGHFEMKALNLKW